MVPLGSGKRVPCTIHTLCYLIFILGLKQVWGSNSPAWLQKIQCRSSPSIQTWRRGGGTGVGGACIRLLPVWVAKIVHGFPVVDPFEYHILQTWYLFPCPLASVALKMEFKHLIQNFFIVPIIYVFHWTESIWPPLSMLHRGANIISLHMYHYFDENMMQLRCRQTGMYS